MRNVFGSLVKRPVFAVVRTGRGIAAYSRRVLDDWWTRTAVIIFILIATLAVFSALSDIPKSHPLLGVFIFAMVPILFVIGGLIFVIANFKLRDRCADEPDAYRGKLGLLIGAGSMGIMLLVFGGYQLMDFTDSPEFCGDLCHTVMKPEAIAHQASPHSSVRCSECHVGSGASYLVKSKVSGVPLIFSTVFNTYDRPISAPVKNLRPARATCEQCHRPEKFTGDLVRINTTYATDDKNTKTVATRVMRIGGGEQQSASGIHWHIAAKVWYLPLDEKRQEIGWVGVEGPDGQLKEYIDPAKKADITPDLISDGKRLMDCTDCHNRATHIFRSPDDLIDSELTQGKIDASLPYIKWLGVNALEPPNSSLSEAIDKVSVIPYFYRNSFPGIYENKRPEIDQATLQLEEIANLTTFPHMKVSWETYPNNVGHQEWPGCFRCHGKLAASGNGQQEVAIEKNCTLCHYQITIQ